jgi:hypothetical protein
MTLQTLAPKISNHVNRGKNVPVRHSQTARKDPHCPERKFYLSDLGVGPTNVKYELLISNFGLYYDDTT